MFRGLVRLIMLLTAIAAAFVAEGYLVAQIGSRIQEAAPVLLKPYNKMIRPIAGRRFSPYALLEHRGRRSGRTYVTPVGAFHLRGRVRSRTILWCRCGLVPQHHGVWLCRCEVAWAGVCSRTPCNHSHEQSCAASDSIILSSTGTRIEGVCLVASRPDTVDEPCAVEQQYFSRV